MAALQLVFLLCAVRAVDGEGIYNILGDPLEFTATKSCQKTGSKLDKHLKNGKDTETVPVAWWDEVWKPESGYTDRMSPNTSVTFSSSNILDGGHYELTCNDSTNMKYIQVYVVEAKEITVTEGENVTLNFHFDYKRGNAKFIRCERDAELVFEVNLSSGLVTNGTKCKDGASLSPNWRTQGDFSLTLPQVQPEDQGDYFFFALKEDGRKTGEKLDAVRMKVMKPRPPLEPTERKEEGNKGTLPTGCIIAITVLASLCLVAVCGFMFHLWWKSRRPNVPSGPVSVEMGLLRRALNGARRSDLSVADGGPEM